MKILVIEPEKAQSPAMNPALSFFNILDFLNIKCISPLILNYNTLLFITSLFPAQVHPPFSHREYFLPQFP